MSDKYLWLSDTHLNRLSLSSKNKFITQINKENPKGIFISGDITNGLRLSVDLEFLATNIPYPIYFTLGNHDYFFSSIERIHNSVRKLCNKYNNLIWLTENDVISLTKNVALIGAEGWCDGQLGNSDYLKYTIDWFLIREFLKFKDFSDIVKYFRFLARESCALIQLKLEKALQDHSKVFVITHLPPWKEATNNVEGLFKDYWLPYNVNSCLGQTIEDAMRDRNQNIVVLCGHTHYKQNIMIDDNIVCKVGEAKLFGGFGYEVIYI